MTTNPQPEPQGSKLTESSPLNLDNGHLLLLGGGLADTRPVSADQGQHSSSWQASSRRRRGKQSSKYNNNNSSNIYNNQNNLNHNNSPTNADANDHDRSLLGQANQHNSGHVKTTDGLTMMHILKANIGTGVLAMPMAFKNIGLWPGFILVPLIGAICIHCMNILIKSHNKLCDRFDFESLDYDQVAALGLACGPRWARKSAKRASIVVTGFLVVTQIGFCCVYIMFVVENLQVAIFNMFKVQYSTTTYMLLVFPVIGLTSCTSNLNHLARISTLANLLQLTGLGFIFVDLIMGTPDSSATNSTVPDQPDVDGIEPIIHQLPGPDFLNGLPLFFATAVYAFEGIGVVLPLVKEMETPERIIGFNGVLNTSMYLVGLLYVAMGFFGYAKYGHLVQSSITLNLPETVFNEIIRLAFATAIGLSYCLQFYVPWTILWPQIDEALFYSYRPRPNRDKLEVLSKFSPEYEKALHLQTDADDAMLTTSSENQDILSDASTLATSYATSWKPSAGAVGSMGGRTSSGIGLASSTGPYGSIIQAGGRSRTRRDRLDDVTQMNRRHSLLWPRYQSLGHPTDLEDNDEDEDELPQVQWRPPPRSMRGKRKLVRYTVIMLTVAFTFVAAALIPRLDLLISLIGSLASSCLAIIFPAIIQMCTFWTDRRNPSDGDPSDEHDQYATNKGPPPISAGWCFLIAKNLFIIVFGIVGLITGTRVSIMQLSAGGPGELPD